MNNQITLESFSARFKAQPDFPIYIYDLPEIYPPRESPGFRGFK